MIDLESVRDIKSIEILIELLRTRVDTAHVKHDNGAEIENIVACALLKELHFLKDAKGTAGKLHYLRNKDSKEVDFAVSVNDRIILMVEVKRGDQTLSRNFKTFEKYFPYAKKIQLVEELQSEKTYAHGAEIQHIIKWLAEIDLEYLALR